MFTKTPPMTVVSPSAMSTCVVADWVRILGMPLTGDEKSGMSLLTSMSRMMVFAEVICGVTLSSRTASLNCTVIVLLATT